MGTKKVQRFPLSESVVFDLDLLLVRGTDCPLFQFFSLSTFIFSSPIMNASQFVYVMYLPLCVIKFVEGEFAWMGQTLSLYSSPLAQDALWFEPLTSEFCSRCLRCWLGTVSSPSTRVCCNFKTPWKALKLSWVLILTLLRFGGSTFIC